MATELINQYDAKKFLLARNKQKHLMEYYLIDRESHNDLMKTVSKNADELFIEVFATEYDPIHKRISLLNNKITPLGKRRINTLEILD
jgi:aspartyl/asparaginyl-tRNA synthetase